MTGRKRLRADYEIGLRSGALDASQGARTDRTFSGDRNKFKLATLKAAGVVWPIFDEGQPFHGKNWRAFKDCGVVAKAFKWASRDALLTFYHHRMAMAAPEKDRLKWLRRARTVSQMGHWCPICPRRGGRFSKGHRSVVARITGWTAHMMTTEPLPALVETLAVDIDSALGRGVAFDDVVLACCAVLADAVEDRPADPRLGRMRRAIQGVRHALGPKRARKKAAGRDIKRPKTVQNANRNGCQKFDRTCQEFDSAGSTRAKRRNGAAVVERVP